MLSGRLARLLRSLLGGLVGWGLGLLSMGKITAAACALSFAASTAVVVLVANMEAELRWAHMDFEVGQVADRDVIADYPLSFVDEEATLARMEAQRSLVPAVFRYLPDATRSALDAWDEFSAFADELALRAEEEGLPPAAARVALQARFPGYFSALTVADFFDAENRAAFANYGREALGAVLARVVFALDEAALGGYNPDVVELLTTRGGVVAVRETVERSAILALRDSPEAIARAVGALGQPPEFAALAGELLLPFLRENAVFSDEDTRLRVAETMERVPPAIRTIERGQRVVRQGFVITSEEMQYLHALRAALPAQAPRGHAGTIMLLAFFYALLVLLRGKPILGKDLPPGQSCLLFALAFAYLAGAALASRALGGTGVFVSLLFPTALFVMLPAVLAGHRAAFALALAFPLGAAAAGFFDIGAYVFALVSGVAASVALRRAEKRMDLIKAGAKIALVNCVALVSIMLTRGADVSEYPQMLALAVLNGIVSGMLTLGLLPPLEHFLNSSTTFRLIELSDLNAPILRKLFTTAPGTYSHSVMVATLAEQACQDIGANALLARVGAYYHDVGKMENPDYFTENQGDHNRHDDIAPRLSATVIRSHLKIGVEKARQLGLPKEVVDIVAEHHGNSIITWFHQKAQEQEGQVNPEDFAYPGTPPHSKEAAVVMLADVTEAAIRSMRKHTATKMEKFIQQLIDDKVAHGQLARSELTFQDLETIKNAFVKVLAGYYHSRIEYPKAQEAGAEAAEGAV